MLILIDIVINLNNFIKYSSKAWFFLSGKNSKHKFSLFIYVLAKKNFWKMAQRKKSDYIQLQPLFI